MNRKFEVWQPLMFSIVLIIGMLVGYRFANQQPNKKIFKSDRANSLQDALDIIRTKYVDSVNIDTLEANALNEMMSELDPHSVYLPPTLLKEATDDLSGSFQGIGVEFTQIRDTVNITYVIPEGPGEKAGLQIGDQIIKVDGKNLTGKQVSTLEVKKQIKGIKGTIVQLDILRNHQPVFAKVTRGNISKSSVSASYMMDSSTGYIRLETFTDNSFRDFMQALENLQKQGMKQLVFDLRGNGGGYLDQAIQITDEFLSGDKLIVYTQGVHSPKQEFRCKRPGLFETGRLMLLVDELSASASEIIAGALQDWGRATIIGRRTFGKGLVQEPFLLRDGAGLRLTVSRYYTPLGRSIQKPYTGGKKVYLDELWERYANGQLFYADSNKVNKGKAFKTTDGRILYGGGGIMPDIFVGLDTSAYSREINKVFLDGTFNDFVFHFYLDNKKILENYSTPIDFSKGYDASKIMWQQFNTWVKRDSINLSGVPAFEKKKVEDRMKAQLARFRWRDAGFYQVMNTNDLVIQKAIEEIKRKG